MRSGRLALVVLVLASAGCGGGPPEVALENRVFYQYDDMPSSGGGSSTFERPYPPLNRAAQGGLPEYVGVSVLGGTVHLSRPASWKIRRASLSAEKRFIEYVSPSQYLFAIYERTDAPSDPWREVEDRYVSDAKAKGAEVLGERVPVATWNAQAREFVVRRTVKGQRAPYVHLSRELLVRSDRRVDLVQIVHQGESIAPVGGELLRVMETLDLR
jgi:hypothetical protein